MSAPKTTCWNCEGYGMTGEKIAGRLVRHPCATCDGSGKVDDPIEAARRDAYRAGLERAAVMANEHEIRWGENGEAARESACRQVSRAIRSEAEKVRNG